MHSIRNYTAAGLALTALLTATPALADTGSNHDGLRFSATINSLLQSFHHDNDGNDDKSGNRTASTTNAVSVTGHVTSVSGNTITLMSQNGGVYTVNGASAVIKADGNTTLTISQIHVNDSLKVKGTLSGGVVTATSITDKSAVQTAATIDGTMSALTGATITLAGSNGTTYTVNTSGASINGSTNVAAELAKFQVGDKLQVKGAVSGTVITATKIKNHSLTTRESLQRFNGVRVGSVASINGSTITIDRFGTGTTSVFTSATTFYASNGSATSSSAVKLGSNLLVFGPTTTSGSNDSITASVVVIFDSGVKFFKHLFGDK